jgi:hypothetical protein
VILKIVPKHIYDIVCPVTTLEHSSDLFRKNLRIFECFQKASRDFISIFFFNKEAQNKIKNICACTHSNNLIS